MSDALGHHLLIDFYGCRFNAISSPNTIHNSLASSLENADLPIEEFTYHENDDEIILIALTSRCHVALHAYPDLGYVAVDIFSFQNEVGDTQIMKELKAAFSAENTKATSVHRADFFKEKDMKPRRSTSITPRGHVKRAGVRLKNTGVKVLRIIRRQRRNKTTD